MRKLALFLIVVFFISCTKTEYKEVEKVVYDTIYIDNYNEIRLLNDSIDYLNSKLNSPSEDLFICETKINRIKKYIAICEKNPSQKTFFFGWIRRAVDE